MWPVLQILWNRYLRNLPPHCEMKRVSSSRPAGETFRLQGRVDNEGGSQGGWSLQFSAGEFNIDTLLPRGTAALVNMELGSRKGEGIVIFSEIFPPLPRSLKFFIESTTRIYFPCTFPPIFFLMLKGTFYFYFPFYLFLFRFFLLRFSHLLQLQYLCVSPFSL